MPNQPKTPARTIRIDDDTWDRLKEAAAQDGRTPSDVIRDLVARYLRRKAAGRG